MKVIFSPRARDELREIQIYIAFDNVAAAARVASRIRGAISILEYPEDCRAVQGRAGKTARRAGLSVLRLLRR